MEIKKILLISIKVDKGQGGRVILIFANQENKRDKKLYHLPLHSFCSTVSKKVKFLEFLPILGMWALFVKNRLSKGTPLQR